MPLETQSFYLLRQCTRASTSSYCPAIARETLAAGGLTHWTCCRECAPAPTGRPSARGPGTPPRGRHQGRAFLAWLGSRGRQLPETASRPRRLVRHPDRFRRRARFLNWAMTSRSWPRLGLPASRSGQRPPISQPCRLAFFHRFLTDQRDHCAAIGGTCQRGNGACGGRAHQRAGATVVGGTHQWDRCTSLIGSVKDEPGQGDLRDPRCLGMDSGCSFGFLSVDQAHARRPVVRADGPPGRARRP
jgi:hypothetical protein